MGKLRAVKRPVTVEQIENDIYHCCRWCHHFQNGKCFNKNVTVNYEDYSSDAMYKISEEGRLSEVLNESFHSVRKSTVTEEIVKTLRGYNLSEKRIKEVYDKLVNSIDEWFDKEVKDRLDNDVSRLYNNVGCEIDGITIQNPEEFYCREFL